MDEGEKKFLAIIQEYGWHVMHVNNVVGEEENPTFSYSTGIYQNFQKPELIIFGLGNDLSGSIINEYGNDIKTNKQEFEANKYYDDFLEGYPVCMIEAHDSARKNILAGLTGITKENLSLSYNVFGLLQLAHGHGAKVHRIT